MQRNGNSEGPKSIESILRAICAGTLLAGLALLVSGCSGSKPEPVAEPVKDNQPAQVEQPKPAEPLRPKPDEVWSQLLADGERLLADQKFEELEAHFSKFDSVYPEGESPEAEKTASLEKLKSDLAEKQEEQLNTRREAMLASAKELVGAGKYEDATQALNEVQKLAPTNEQREAVAAISADVESRRNARRRLSTWMQLLGSEDKKDVRTAQTQLHKEAETALPILLETVQNDKNPLLVANTLELLRRLQRPDSTLPAMLGVLKRESQAKNWNDAVREIGRTSAPGAGAELLTLATTSKNPEQRTAALAALGQVPDPPAETLVKLLPRIFEDSPDLPSALQAAAQAVRQHRQSDVIARRGLDMELSSEEDQLLAKLPERLQRLIEAEAASNPPSDVAVAARKLGSAIRLFAPQAFESVKVLSFGAQSDDGKAAAVLDGVWDKVEYPTMWRHPIDKRSSLILDLGEEKTVEGVRIWNFNEPGGTHRGWKEVEIYVTNTPTALTPVATGVVPPAPGVAGTPDYSIVVPVPSVRGRYITLQAKSVWRPDTYMGLSEVQILGH